MNWKPYVCGVLKCTVFGLTFLFIKRLLLHLTMLELLAYRFLLAGLSFEVLRLFRVIQIDLKGKNIRPLFVIALFQPVCYYLFETIGVARVSSVMAGILLAVLPLFTVTLETVFLKERTSPIQKLGIVICVGGVVLISLFTSSEGGTSTVIGIFFVLLAVLSESLFSIYSRKWVDTFSAIEMVYVMMWVGAVVFNACNLVQKIANGTYLSYFAPMLHTNVLLCLLYLGVLASCLAFIIYEYMLANVKASVVNTFSGLTTLVTILAGVFLNHEYLYWYHIVGALCIFLGLLFAVGFFKKQNSA